jgi:trans-2-enoyl-CoA reductase
MFATIRKSAFPLNYRCFSTTTALMVNQRAIYYESHGDPSKVLSAITLPALAEPSGSAVNLRVLLTPINPSDINAVQGVYPLKPEPTKLANGGSIYIPGNEGLAQVEQVGPEVHGLANGDWVIFAKKQAGTWSSGLTVNETDVIKVNKVDGFTDVHAATLSVRSPIIIFLNIEAFMLR